MSSAASPKSSAPNLSTLSTALLAASCTALVAATIFVLFALRRYLKARKANARLSKSQLATNPLQSFDVKDRSISTDDVGKPYLPYAPDHSHFAHHELREMPSQRTLVSSPFREFFKKPDPSPTMPEPALLSPRMFPAPSSIMSAPKSPKSPGLTALTLSPGPSILLKPMAYGRSPQLSPQIPPNNNKEGLPDQKENKDRSRGAVSSMLLRSLGVLSDFGASDSRATTPNQDVEKGSVLEVLNESETSMASSNGLSQNDDQATKEIDEPSLTPILDLGIDFGSDLGFVQSLKLRDDSSYTTKEDAWAPPASTDLNQETTRHTTAAEPKMSKGMSELVEALSPISTYSSSPPHSVAMLPLLSSSRAPLPTPPPSASLPPAPVTARLPMTKQPSSSSVLSKSSKSTTHSVASSSSTSRSYHSAVAAPRPSMGSDQVAIDVPSHEHLSAEDHDSQFRPLSLGLGLGISGSGSQGTFATILGNLRKTPSNTDLDLETGSTSMGSSSSRSFSSENLSNSSSQTSIDMSHTSIGKANVVQAASIPPLPPMPVSFLKNVGDETPKASHHNTFVSQTAQTPSGRKRASTLGALDLPTIQIPDLLHPRSAPMPPGVQLALQQIQQPQMDPVQVQRVGLTIHKANSTESLPLNSGKGATMNFASPYHRALYPDPPLNGGHLSPGLPPDSPVFAQLSPRTPASPRLSFGESLKSRLSLSRKSVTSSPGQASRSSTPHFGTIDKFPMPREGDVPAQWTDGSKTPPTNSELLKAKLRIGGTKGLSVASSGRPATSPVIEQGKKQIGLDGLSSPQILFNGETVEPTRPLRLRKPGSAGGRLDGAASPQPRGSSLSPVMKGDGWGKESPAGNGNNGDDVGSVDYGFVSPLMAGSEAALSPMGELIEFGSSSPRFFSEMSPDIRALSPVQTSSLLAYENANSPRPSPLQHSFTASSPIEEEPEDMHTPRARSSGNDDEAIEEVTEAQPETDFEHDMTRDSVISVAASTISIATNSSCASDAISEDLEQAADRRAKLLASVQQNLAKAKAKDAKRDSQAASRIRKSTLVAASSALRNIPEELSGGLTMLGLGLFEEEEEAKEIPSAETVQEDESGALDQGTRKPANLVLMPENRKLGNDHLVGPLTPPLTPVDAKAALDNASKHGHTPSTSSASSAASLAAHRAARQNKARLAPIDTAAANRLLSPAPEHGSAPSMDSSSPSSSLKLRPLSLAASLSGEISPMKRFERAAFSPALSANIPSPSPAHAGERSSRYNEEGRSSRNTTYRQQGGVLPTISSKGALQTGRASHAPSLTHSDNLSPSESSSSMGSMTSSLGSLSSMRMGHFPSPVRSSFSNTSLASRMTGLRPMATTKEEDVPALPNSISTYSHYSTSSSNSYSSGRIGYKTSEPSFL